VTGKVQTKVSYGKPGQDKARVLVIVRESRYVIKVMNMNDKTGRGWRSLGLSEPEPKDVPHLLIG
jgi:hypothetical protein